MSVELASKLQHAIQCLKNGLADEAVSNLEAVINNPQFSSAVDFDDIRARTHSLYAQALLEIEAFDKARNAAEQAFAISKQLRDDSGTNQIRELLRRISARQLSSLQLAGAIRKQEESAARPLETLMNTQTTSTAESLLKEAALKMRAHEFEDAAKIARFVLNLNTAAEKDRIVSLLLLAQINSKEPQKFLEDAWALADVANDFNLLQAVARTAEQLDFPIAVLKGPQMED